jgi:hypothetical protein
MMKSDLGENEGPPPEPGFARREARCGEEDRGSKPTFAGS